VPELLGTRLPGSQTTLYVDLAGHFIGGTGICFRNVGTRQQSSQVFAAAAGGLLMTYQVRHHRRQKLRFSEMAGQV
jgi:hypothetical protein